MDKLPFSDKKARTNPNGKRRAAGGCGGSTENHPPSVTVTHGRAERGRAGQGRAAAPKNGWATGKCTGPRTASPLLAVRISGVYPDHPEQSEWMQTRVAPCLPLQKEPFPPRWMGNADRQPGPVKPQMCAISVVFLLRASASLCCEREPSFDSGKHINACLNSSSFSKSIRLHLMDFSET